MVAGRRAAALAAAAAVAGIGATGCGGSSGDSSSDSAKTRDLKILSRVESRENRLVAAAAASGSVLRGADAARGIALLRSAETHTAYLTRAINKLGGTPHQPRKDYSSQVGGRRTRARMLHLLAGLAARVAAADARDAAHVSDEDFRGLTQGVAAGDRRHADALRRALAE